MRISFNKCDRMPGDCLDIHSYDCFLNGKLFPHHWHIADEEKGEIEIFKRDKDTGKIILNKLHTKPLMETFTGVVELKLKKGARDE